MKIPHFVRQCSFQLGEKTGSEVRFGGTGFIVEVPNETSPKIGHVYAVTTNHSIEATRSKEQVLRFNFPSIPLSYEVEIPPQTKWFTHPNRTTDVAVLPLEPSVLRFGVLALPLPTFINAKKMMELDLGIGDEVFTLGLFSFLPGKEVNQFIARTGNLAMVPCGS